MAPHVRPTGFTCTRLDQYALADAVATVSGLHPSRHRLATHYLLDRGEGPGARYAIMTSQGVGVEAPELGYLPVWTLDGRTTYSVPVVQIGLAAGASEDRLDLAKAIRPFDVECDARHAEWFAWARRAAAPAPRD